MNYRYNKRPYKRSTNNKTMWILIFIILVLVITGIVFVINSCSHTPQNNNTQLNINDTNNNTTAQADPSRLIITLYGSQDTYVAQGEDYIEPGCHVTDKQDGDLTANVKISGNVDTSKVGEYTITYNAVNKSGMQATKTRRVHVVDNMQKDPGNGIPVLMYHYVYTSQDTPDNLDGNYILDTDLEQQLQYLKNNDYYYPSYQELLGYIKGTHSLPEKSVILTFDDGQIGFLKYGIPLFEKYQIPATSFLVVKDNIAPKIENASEYVSFQSHSYNMHRAGGNIGHGGVISALSYDEILSDLREANSQLGASEAFAYPYGDTTDDAKRAVKDAGITCAFTTNYNYVHPGDDPSCLSRIRISGGISIESFKSLV